MIRCEHCQADVPANARFCPSCATPVSSSSQMPTALEPPSPVRFPSSSVRTPSGIDAAPFAPGQMLGDRYRIVGLLGRGGMGEVFRADDLRLGQPVALKFLPKHLSSDPARLERFHAEVRNAREVAHPHVCRVYDIGDADGRYFLSMEYVDGEDLGTLLRRIGRLPPAKAVEIARQVCAGLAAAHERGVIHRDLKPQNIMLDGHGRARITDFGLAVRGDEAVAGGAGTPAYMSPEQLAGSPATVQSDLYSLGLVLYEIFTGKRVFEASTFAEWQRKHGHEAPTSPSIHTTDVEPAVERVILRCLEKDPARRPSSASQIALALPGGDPLAAAIAAGETPSPQMVAAAGGEGALSRGAAGALFSGFLGITLAIFLLAPYSTDLGLAPMERSPSELRARARDLATRFGYQRTPADTASWLERDYEPIKYLAGKYPSTEWRAKLASYGAPILFHFRQSPRPMVPTSGLGLVTELDPPPEVSGMALVVTDSQGHLRYFRGIPPQVEEEAPKAASLDWGVVFGEAGLDPGRFQAVEPTWLPPVPFDQRGEWTGTIPEAPSLPLRAVAGAYHGKLVYFELLGVWSRADRMTERRRATGMQIGEVTLTLMALGLMVAGVYFARRNIRQGRGDRKGSFRVALFVLSVALVLFALTSHYAGPLTDWMGQVFWPSVSAAVFLAGMHWMMYMAIEPYVRRKVPELLIGWARLLEGKLRDARVGRDLLAGIILGASFALLHHLVNGLPTFFSLAGQTTIPPRGLIGPEFTNPFSFLPWVVSEALIRGLSGFSVYFLLRSLLRSTVAATIGIGILALLLSLGGENPWLEVPAGLLMAIGITFCITRLGILSVVSMWLAFLTLINLPVTLDVSRWDAAVTIPSVVVLAALATYAFRISIGSQPVFGSGTIDD